MADDLPDDVQQFVRAHVDSIAQLEVLLLPMSFHGNCYHDIYVPFVTST